MLKVKIRLFDLSVELESTANHPDAVTDLVNRATTMFISAVATAKSQDIKLIHFEDDDEDAED